MIITETLTRDDGATLLRRYSDAGYMLRQNETGALYSEAVDVEGAPYTYVESDIPAEVETPDPESLQQAARHLLGQRLVNLPTQDQPDYFNEDEPEPTYFNEED